jgi:hypothetical protein
LKLLAETSVVHPDWGTKIACLVVLAVFIYMVWIALREANSGGSGSRRGVRIEKREKREWHH